MSLSFGPSFHLEVAFRSQKSSCNRGIHLQQPGCSYMETTYFPIFTFFLQCETLSWPVLLKCQEQIGKAPTPWSICIRSEEKAFKLMCTKSMSTLKYSNYHHSGLKWAFKISRALDIMVIVVRKDITSLREEST